MDVFSSEVRHGSAGDLEQTATKLIDDRVATVQLTTL